MGFTLTEYGLLIIMVGGLLNGTGMVVWSMHCVLWRICAGYSRIAALVKFGNNFLLLSILTAWLQWTKLQKYIQVNIHDFCYPTSAILVFEPTHASGHTSCSRELEFYSIFKMATTFDQELRKVGIIFRRTVDGLKKYSSSCSRYVFSCCHPTWTMLSWSFSSSLTHVWHRTSKDQTWDIVSLGGTWTAPWPKTNLLKHPLND